MELIDNYLGSQNNDELFFILAIIGFSGMVLLIGTFFASLYIEKVSAHNDEDIEGQHEQATRAEMSQLRHWVESKIDHSRNVDLQFIKQQREEMEDYVHKRLREHLTIFTMRSPPSLGYGTFSPGSGTSRGGSPRSGYSSNGYLRSGYLRCGDPLNETSTANISKGKHTANTTKEV
ncbi:hypothetical protein P171DRAFT_486228 [Karstenula rhodostoma CBS 690.94]|uniref:Uncharacterized protein n=1 Tax=Karstenula rhodostoma CBS 690.94 TaxID=1392251 RepID=A0A9P4UAW8_9PLEO|nr:hypothetical protein P171DRAFT_486228 [Karstenula rhodostoma CBS 690.94]